MNRIMALLAVLVVVMLPIKAEDDKETLVALIKQAIEQKQSTLKLPPKEYRLAPPLEIKGLRNMTIDATGSTFVFTSYKDYGIIIRDCSEMILKGLSIDYDPLPFTQGVVSAINADSTEIHVQISKGYPLLKDDYVVNRMHIFNPVDRRLKMDVGDIYGKVKPSDDGRSGVFLLKEPESALRVGDLAVFNIRKFCSIYITSGSSNNTFEDLTIFTSPGIGVLSRFALGGDTFRRYVIKRGARPVGADSDRLFSTCADGLNYAYTRSGITMEECDFSFMGDDSVNFHGPALPVFKVDADGTVWTVRPHNFENFAGVVKAGDEVRIIAEGNFAVTGRSQIVSFTSRPGIGEISPELLAKFFPLAHARGGKFKATLYGIKLSENKEIKPGSFIDIPHLAAEGFVIRNNYFHDHRARGLRIMTRNGIIENNRFERIKHSAISIGAEYSKWREAGWPENIVIRNNILTDTAVAVETAGKGSYALGAIALFCRRDDVNLPPYAGIDNITITGNTISGSGVAGIFLNCARNCKVENNRITHVLQRDTIESGSDFGLKITGAVTVVNSENVQVVNN